MIMNAEGETSWTLLERVRANDQTAWRTFVEVYSPLVYSWCRRSGLQQWDAADVVQEVFRAVATHIGQFRRDRPGGAFRGWLRGIARHKIQGFWRHAQQHEQARGGTTGLRQMSELPCANELDTSENRNRDQDELSRTARRAMELVRREVNEQTWRAAWLVLVEGETIAATAKQLRITTNAVYKAKARVLRRLREKLADDELAGPM